MFGRFINFNRHVLGQQEESFKAMALSHVALSDSLGRAVEFVGKQNAAAAAGAMVRATKQRPKVRNRPRLGQPAPRKQQDLSNVRMISATHLSLPIGQICVNYGYRKYAEEDDEDSLENHTMVADWAFHPAPWISNRAFITRAMLQVRYGPALAIPGILPSLKTTMCLSDSNPVWGCIRDCDIQGFRKHLRAGDFGINDTSINGFTLIAFVSFADRETVCPLDVKLTYLL